MSKSRNEAESYRRKLAKVEAQLSFAQQTQYGDRRQKLQGEDEEDGGENIGGGSQGCDRMVESEEFDGTGAVSVASSREPGRLSKSSSTGQGIDVRNRPSSYHLMHVEGKSIRHKSDRSQLPGGARVFETKEVMVYTLETNIVCHKYELLHVSEKGKNPYWTYLPKGEKDALLRVRGTKASPAFMQALAYEVYMKGVTFGNLHQWLRDMGMTISSNTLHNWLSKGKGELDKLIPFLKEAALEKDAIVHCDETWCKVRRYNKYSKEYMWVLVNKAHGIVIFFYDEGSRGRKVLTDFIGESELKALMSDGYNAYTFLDGELVRTDHLICMAHARAKLVKAANQGGDKEASEIVKLIDVLFRLEDSYRIRKLAPDEILRERQGPETESIVEEIRERLRRLQEEASSRSDYMQKGLNYLEKFWGGLFLYRKDGSYPLSNNLAERSIRPFTTKRKTSNHFGSDAGAEMSAVYHSVISTVKLQQKSVWDFFGKFFRGVVTGEKDYMSLMPAAIQ